jgi:hypothetical protein
VLDALEIKYRSNPLSDDMSGTRVGFVSFIYWLVVTAHRSQLRVLTVLINFISHLWLTDRQISKLSIKFMPAIPIRPSDPVFWVASSFIDNLQELRRESEVNMPDPIASLSSSANVKTLAVELAQSLTVLEDTLRRTDSVGECIRWSTRNHRRDFLSFPERVSSICISSPRHTKTKDASKVEIWVLQSILREEQPEHVGLRYLLFYKVAKVSLFICNSSMQLNVLSTAVTGASQPVCSSCNCICIAMSPADWQRS